MYSFDPYNVFLAIAVLLKTGFVGHIWCVMSFSLFRSGSGQQDPLAMELVFPERSLLGSRPVCRLFVRLVCLHVCFLWPAGTVTLVSVFILPCQHVH